MQRVVKHSGRVVEVNKKCVRVSVMAQSACASCHAKDVCGSGDQKEKLIDVHRPKGEYAVGDMVEVVLTLNNGNKAVVLAYVLPFVVLMIVLLGLLALGYGEAFAALWSIVALVLYYYILYICRHRIEKKIHFTLRKLT